MNIDAMASGEHPIQYKYTLWYMRRTPASRQENYEQSIKPIGSFDTVEKFWGLYNHLVRPNDLPNTTDYHLFKDGIKPVWEDPSNRRGGKWMVRLKKGLATRYWEEILLAIVGEQFDVGDEICGAVLSIRFQEDIISIWNRNAENHEATHRIRDLVRSMLKLPHFVMVEYKRHDASITDNSSFRNTSTWRKESPRHGPQRGSFGDRPSLRSPPRSPSGPHGGFGSPRDSRSGRDSWNLDGGLGGLGNGGGFGNMQHQNFGDSRSPHRSRVDSSPHRSRVDSWGDKSGLGARGRTDSWDRGDSHGHGSPRQGRESSWRSSKDTSAPLTNWRSPRAQPPAPPGPS